MIEGVFRLAIVPGRCAVCVQANDWIEHRLPSTSNIYHGMADTQPVDIAFGRPFLPVYDSGPASLFETNTFLLYRAIFFYLP